VLPYGPIELDPSAIVLHYAQEVFDGLKAYRWADGSIVLVPAGGQRQAATLVGAPAWRSLSCQKMVVSSSRCRQLIAVDRAMGASCRAVRSRCICGPPSFAT